MCWPGLGLGAWAVVWQGLDETHGLAEQGAVGIVQRRRSLRCLGLRSLIVCGLVARLHRPLAAAPALARGGPARGRRVGRSGFGAQAAQIGQG